MVNVKYFIEGNNDKNTLQNCTTRHLLQECTEWKCDKLKLETFNIVFLVMSREILFLDDFIISSKISVLNYETTKVQNPLPMTVEIQISVDEAVNQII